VGQPLSKAAFNEFWASSRSSVEYSTTKFNGEVKDVQVYA